MQDNKLFYRSIYAALFMGASTILFSCNDDIRTTDEYDSDLVCFRLNEANWGNAADTRAANSLREIDRAVLRSVNSKDTLCVSAIETDGINLGTSTRGSQISTINDLSSFGCLAYVGKTSGQYTMFYINNDEYTKNGNIYQSDNIQYWPGSALNFKFYCYSPYNASGLTLPQSTESTILEYVVPNSVSDQKDLMLAAPGEEFPGNYNKQVDLSFKHLLSAVRIVTGENMMAGTIKSITFSNLYGSANIDMDNPSEWIGHSDYKTFTFAPEGGVAVTGTANQEIMAGTNTMLMLPQAMQPEASLDPTMLRIVFNDGSNAEDRVLETELTGEWQMGKTYTYRLSITPEYELEFTQDNPSVVDAHYGIVPIKIKANELKAGWTISSNQSWATLKSQLTPFEQQGYWLDNTGDYTKYCNSFDPQIPVERTEQITGTIQGDEVVLYLFISENTGTTDRQVTLSVRPSDQPNATPSTITISQKCPEWIGDMGWEQMEEDENLLPFGFKWDRNVTYTRTFSNLISSALNQWILKVHFAKPGANSGWHWIDPVTADYVNVQMEWRTVNINIDYTKISNVSGATSETAGLDNTYSLFTASGQSAFDGETYLIENGYEVLGVPSGSLERPSNYAALYAVKKNKFQVKEVSGATDNSYALDITQSDIKWYLPAIGQFGSVPGSMNSSNRQYWSSTANNDGSTAQAWNGSSTTPRMNNNYVRAVRVKE